MSFYRTNIVKSPRKRRRCNWCGEHIEIGETCVYYSCIWEGDFQDGHFHAECEKPCGDFCHENDEYSFGEGVRGKPEVKECYQ